METKNRQKMLFILVGVAAVLYIGDTFIAEPLMASWKERSARIDELNEKIQKGKLMLSGAQSIRGNWDEKRTNALPSDQSAAEAQLFKSFDRWERSSGISRVSIKPQWKDSDTNYNTLECRADYTGSIDRVKRFLYEVEKDPTGLKIENVEISSRDDNGRQLSLGLQVSGLQLNPQPAPSQQ